MLFPLHLHAAKLAPFVSRPGYSMFREFSKFPNFAALAILALLISAHTPLYVHMIRCEKNHAVEQFELLGT